MEKQVIIGRVSLVLRGEYDSGITYDKFDTVTYDGSSYASKITENTYSPDNSDYWMLLAEKGKSIQYSDLTPEQIKELQKPATDAAESITALENSITQAEADRVNSENERKSAENLRIQSETERQTAEANRLQAETLRQEKENTREQSEEDRNTAEQLRVTSEQVRVSAEQLRVSKETERIQAEQLRTQAETVRVESESTRVTAETQRVQSETQRVQAESARVDAEQARVTEFNQLKQESQTATNNANSATTSANEAAENANNVAATVESRLSEVYTNYDAIISSGETNTNKIYIDGATNTSYRYDGVGFVSIGGNYNSKFVSRIDGQVPILGIRYVDIGDWALCSKDFHDVFYDEENKIIYAQAGGNSTTGGLCKIKNDKIIAYLRTDTTKNNTSGRCVVKIGEFVYAINFGWTLNSYLLKINDTDLSISLQVLHTGILAYDNANQGLYYIGEELYLLGVDSNLYLVNKDDLSLSEPIFSGIQYVLQYSNNKLVIADSSSIFEYDGGIEKVNQKDLPQGFETIIQIENGFTISTSFGAFIFLVNNEYKVRTLYLKSDTLGSTGTTILLSNKGKQANSLIYNMKKIYNVPSSHDYNVFRDISGILYYSKAGSANFSTSYKETFDALCLNPGAYNWGDTPIYPTYRGFLM